MRDVIELYDVEGARAAAVHGAGSRPLACGVAVRSRRGFEWRALAAAEPDMAGGGVARRPGWTDRRLADGDDDLRLQQ